MGSSPRIRGKYHGCRRLPRRSGIIPANTGKIDYRRCAKAGQPDHPREYGENPMYISHGSEIGGSSPRIRGEYNRDLWVIVDPRIIPANTGRIDDTEFSGVSARGSSPRIRGECDHAFALLDFHRIIPANTGRMLSCTPLSLRGRDHPREYGENAKRWRQIGKNMGSSPRIRGELNELPPTALRGGIIPANTGRIHVQD